VRATRNLFEKSRVLAAALRASFMVLVINWVVGGSLSEDPRIGLNVSFFKFFRGSFSFHGSKQINGDINPLLCEIPLMLHETCFITSACLTEVK